MIFTITMHDSYGTRLQCETPNMSTDDHAAILLDAFPPSAMKPSIKVIKRNARLYTSEDTIYVPSAHASIMS